MPSHFFFLQNVFAWHHDKEAHGCEAAGGETRALVGGSHLRSNHRSLSKVQGYDSRAHERPTPDEVDSTSAMRFVCRSGLRRRWRCTAGGQNANPGSRNDADSEHVKEYTQSEGNHGSARLANEGYLQETDRSAGASVNAWLTREAIRMAHSARELATGPWRNSEGVSTKRSCDWKKARNLQQRRIAAAKIDSYGTSFTAKAREGAQQASGQITATLKKRRCKSGKKTNLMRRRTQERFDSHRQLTSKWSLGPLQEFGCLLKWGPVAIQESFRSQEGPQLMGNLRLPCNARSQPLVRKENMFVGGQDGWRSQCEYTYRTAVARSATSHTRQKYKRSCAPDFAR